ncbi:MAG: radical SAM protein, partial [Methanoculleus sp.]|nr:radical SAM protein [Methanoculleus sp.]
MNRITQCMHGRGTVSGVMRHQNRPLSEMPGKYLAFARDYRPVVFWNLTDRCNLACAHCYSRSGPACGTEEELSTGEALTLIENFAAAGVPLILFSGGEPLLREALPELARAAANRGLRTALSTNGTL